MQKEKNAKKKFCISWEKIVFPYLFTWKGFVCVWKEGIHIASSLMSNVSRYWFILQIIARLSLQEMWQGLVGQQETQDTNRLIAFSNYAIQVFLYNICSV